MSKIDKLIARLSAIKDFSELANVLEIETRETFAINGNHIGESYIIINYTDTTHTIKIVDNEEVVDAFEPHKYFWVKNAKRVAFVPLDGKRGIIKSGNKRADVIFFDESDFCFLEFKTEAISLREGKVNKNRKEAIEQIAVTVTLFNEKLGHDYEGLKCEAYIVTPPSYPKESAVLSQKRVEFLETYGMALYESNEKSCKQSPIISDANQEVLNL